MSSAKTRTGKRPQNKPATHSVEIVDPALEVLTLSEAAAYLRVSEEDVLRLAQLQELPGRRIGDDWRFLKTALQDWLRTPVQRSGKEALLALAGVWKDDPDIEEMVREAMRKRRDESRRLNEEWETC